MAYKAGLDGALYIDGVILEYVSSITIGIDREVAEAAVMGDESGISRVGVYRSEFSGTALMNTASNTIFDEVTGSATTTSVISVYPDRTNTTNGWWFNGQFSRWNVSAGTGDFWSIDFGGVCEGDVTALGFS